MHDKPMTGMTTDEIQAFVDNRTRLTPAQHAEHEAFLEKLERQEVCAKCGGEVCAECAEAYLWKHSGPKMNEVEHLRKEVAAEESVREHLEK